MRRKWLKILAWLALIAIVIFFNNNLSVMAGAVVILLVMNYGPGIFIKIALKIKQMLWHKVKTELKNKTRKASHS